MQPSGGRVEPLKRVVIRVSSGKKVKGEQVFEPDKPVSFIFGLGSQGLSPFEMALEGKRPGDVVMFDLTNEDRLHFFGHVLLYFMPDQGVLDSQFLRVVVEEIRDAHQREIIRELAEITEFGHGCSCCS